MQKFKLAPNLFLGWSNFLRGLRHPFSFRSERLLEHILSFFLITVRLNTTKSPYGNDPAFSDEFLSWFFETNRAGTRHHSVLANLSSLILLMIPTPGLQKPKYSRVV